MLVGHGPQHVESWFGDGSRWGCTIRYHLTLELDRPYRSLKVLDRVRTEPWLLVYGTRFASTTFPGAGQSMPLVYQEDASHPESSLECWTSTTLFPAGFEIQRIAAMNLAEFSSYMKHLLASNGAQTVACAEWLDGSTPEALLRTQKKLLTNCFPGLMLSGTETAPSIRIARNVQIPDSVQMFAPLYIGSNCRIGRGVRLGPNVVLSGDCVIDANTSLENCLITSGNYIGEGLEVESAVVDHELLVSVRHQTAIRVAESFLLGKLQQPLQFAAVGTVARLLLASMLLLLLSPLLLLTGLYYAFTKRSWTSVAMVEAPQLHGSANLRTFLLPCLGGDAWTTRRPAGWSSFLRQFLPGLIAVATGRLRFVGITPRTEAEVAAMTPQQRALYLSSSAGLITEASIAEFDTWDADQFSLVEAYYNARRGPLYSLQIAYRYVLRLVSPAASVSARPPESVLDA
jgi:lipopolysaccharide/colanic/teichoic acid biosynthesis glycosyltransferase